jgi:hypothetical protein
MLRGEGDRGKEGEKFSGKGKGEGEGGRRMMGKKSKGGKIFLLNPNEHDSPHP